MKSYKHRTIFSDRDAKKFKRFAWSMPKLVTAMCERIEQKRDETVLVTGKTGVGKSTIVGKLCFNHFQDKDNILVPEEKMFEDSNFVIDPKKYAALMVSKKGCVIWLDEAVDSVNRRNWHSKINNLIVNRKNKNRKNGIISFVVLPYEKEVDKNFMKHINMWIWVYKRGHAQVFVAGNHRKGGESLNVDKIIERENKYLKENPNTTFVPPWIHPEFIGNIAFGSFSKQEEKRYENLITENKAVGELSEEEEELVNPVDHKEPEEYIPEVLDSIEKGEIKSKREMWDKLKELTKFSDALLVRHINRHLKIRGYKTFNSFVVNPN